MATTEEAERDQLIVFEYHTRLAELALEHHLPRRAVNHCLHEAAQAADQITLAALRSDERFEAAATRWSAIRDAAEALAPKPSTTLPN